jgi:branched-chain amino acid aminotransferase
MKQNHNCREGHLLLKESLLTSVQNMLVYIDGVFCPSSDAKISVFDHGLLYGDGIFEGICVYEGRIFRLDQHLKRLYESAKTIGLQIPLTPAQFEAAIVETVERNRLRDGYIRPIVTRGVGKLGLDPKNCQKPSVIIIPQNAKSYPLLTAGRKPARAIVSSIRRTPSYSLPASAKTLNYLNNILAKQQATYAGVDEAIMLDWMGFVSEGTGDNLFIVRRGVLLTPPLHSSVLGGITRQVVLEAAQALGISSEERELTIHDLYNADEAFFASTSLEIQPVIEIDGRVVGDGTEGQFTKRIREKFNETKQTEGTQALQ